MCGMRWIGLLWLTVIADAGAHTPPETRLLQQAVAALGGAERIFSAKTLVIVGEGRYFAIDENLNPGDGKVRTSAIADYKRSVDLSTGRWKMQQLRYSPFPFAVPAPTTILGEGLDGDVAYNFGGPLASSTLASRQSAWVARERRLEELHHPLTSVRAALDPASKVTHYRDQGQLQLVDITTANGDLFTLAINRNSHLPAYVASLGHHQYRGDVIVETTFKDYAETSGLKLPRRLTTRLNHERRFDFTVSTKVDSDIGDLRAPKEVVAAVEPPVLGVQKLTPRRISKGVWYFPSFFNSMLFEFSDHLTLLEAPLNDGVALALFSAAKELVPNKPLTQVIVSHGHGDHAGGVREAISRGLIVIVHRSVADYINALAKQPHTVVPDELAKIPRAPKIELVDDELILKDEENEIRVYHVRNDSHAASNLMIFVPSAGLVWQADIFGTHYSAFPGWENLQKNIAVRGLTVEKHLPSHGELQTAEEAAETVSAKAAATAALKADPLSKTCETTALARSTPANCETQRAQ
jgi:glyoxylase-like metal-dependent hydrolase (beta-lactamase superfamily II)